MTIVILSVPGSAQIILPRIWQENLFLGISQPS